MQDVSQLARVKVLDQKDLVIIPITTEKPDIPEPVERKWQKIVDLVARIMNVPSGLITRLTTENLEIFVASTTKGNPYKKNDHDRLGIGMFCETVAGHRDKMLVQDTGLNEYWKNNPHAGLGMKSYLGVPIVWEDGEIFGTFCMLTNLTNRFSNEFQDLMLQFKEIIEADLNYILLNEELKKKLSNRDLQLREVHHRIKNHFNLLISLITLQEMEQPGDFNEVLQDLQNKVRTLSLIHEKLQMSGSNDVLLLDNYLEDLCRVTVSGFMGVDIEMKFDIDRIELPLDQCVPVGLIISELVSNSVKYGSPEKGNPLISLTARATEVGILDVEYCDNGSGYKMPFPSDRNGSLGVSLIRMLTEQLGGTMDLSNRNGAVYRARLKAG